MSLAPFERAMAISGTPIKPRFAVPETTFWMTCAPPCDGIMLNVEAFLLEEALCNGGIPRRVPAERNKVERKHDFGQRWRRALSGRRIRPHHGNSNDGECCSDCAWKNTHALSPAMWPAFCDDGATNSFVQSIDFRKSVDCRITVVYAIILVDGPFKPGAQCPQCPPRVLPIRL